MRLFENEENEDRKRFIEISFTDFSKVINAAVRCHLTEDAVIFYDDPIDNGKPAAIGSDVDDGKTDGYRLKADYDWGIDLQQCGESDGDWHTMLGEKVYEVAKAFSDWCLERDMVIMVDGKEL